MQGFILDCTYPITEKNGTMYVYHHAQNGAQLIFLETKDVNKLFSVAFRTIPENDKGVFHILEHSLLGGSQKYPVKEPFTEMLKNSMNTYLNALTFADMTLFPLSSRNEKDFFNLMSVYLDAVFAPLIYENPNIFAQEGWHFELRDPEDEATLKGVVLNEMKGAEAEAETLLQNEIMRLLYPNSCYGYVSGGDTKAIPTLTYEEFLEAHRRFYHPSNAIFYMEGQVDLEAAMAMIEPYMETACDGKPVEIPYETEKVVAFSEGRYAVSPGEETENRSWIAFGKIICDYSDTVKMESMNVLADYLTESNESPLAEAILSNDLAQDVELVLMDGILQPAHLIQLAGTEKENLPKIREAVENLRQAFREKGIDKAAVTAIINQMDFRNREKHEPRALGNNVQVLHSLRFGGAPERNLLLEAIYRQMRENLKTDYFEKLLDELLNLEDMSTVVMVPSESLGMENEAAEAAYVKAMQSGWTEEEKAAIIAANRRLDLWQSEEDSPEKLASLPTLDLSDIDPYPAPTGMIMEEQEGIRILYSPKDISGVCYVNLYFPVPVDLMEDLTDLALSLNLYMELSTKRSVLELNTDVSNLLGGISFDLLVSGDTHDRLKATVYLMIKTRCLKANIPHAMRLVKEVIEETDFTQVDHAGMIMDQLLEDLRNDVIGSGNQLGILKAASGFAAASMLNEKTGGMYFYERLKAICKNWKTEGSAYMARLKTLTEKVFTRDHMVIGMTLPVDEAQSPEKRAAYQAEAWIRCFPEGPVKEIVYEHTVTATPDTFIKIPSAVSYATQVGNMCSHGYAYHSGWRVIAKLVSLDFLWNEVRVKGGAYDAAMMVADSGNVDFFSYRDPDSRASFETFKKVPDFLRAIADSQKSLDSYIISTINDVEPLVSPQIDAFLDQINILSDIDDKEIAQSRGQMLAIKPQDLYEAADVLDAVLSDSVRCLVSSEMDVEMEEALSI